MHCGWPDIRDRWVDPMIGVPADFEADICPGWLVRQPAVCDGMRAWRARDQKALEIFDPERLAIVWEMTEIADAAVSQYQNEKLKTK